jgi:hypothetical protein
MDDRKGKEKSIVYEEQERQERTDGAMGWIHHGVNLHSVTDTQP